MATLDTEAPAAARTPSRAIAAMCAAMVFFVANDVLTKLAAAELPVGELIALRGVFASVIVLTVVLLTRQAGHLPRLANARVLGRAVLEALAAFTFITAIAHMPIASATIIFLAAPLVMTALAVPLLKEQVGWRRWTAVVVGFVGALVVLRPGTADFNVFGLFALACAFIAALRDIVTRTLDPAIPSLVVAVATTLAVTVFGAALAPFEVWVVPSASTVGLLAGAAVLLAIGNVLIISAFRAGDVSAVAPFRYTIVVWATLGGYLVFGEVLDAVALAGTGLIVGAGLYTLHREALRKRGG